MMPKHPEKRITKRMRPAWRSKNDSANTCDCEDSHAPREDEGLIDAQEPKCCREKRSLTCGLHDIVYHARRDVCRMALGDDMVMNAHAILLSDSLTARTRPIRRRGPYVATWTAAMIPRSSRCMLAMSPRFYGECTGRME